MVEEKSRLEQAFLAAMAALENKRDHRPFHAKLTIARDARDELVRFYDKHRRDDQ